MPLPRPEVCGIDLDAQTRCVHYRTALDIIAIKMRCCGVYYACKDCHEASADHPIEVWPGEEWSQPAVLCGACGYELSVAQYMESGYTCPIAGLPSIPDAAIITSFTSQIPSPEGKGERLYAGIEKLDHEYMVGDGALLPHQLV